MLIMRKIALLSFLIIGFSNAHAWEPYEPQLADPIEESWRWRHFSELDGMGVKDIEEAQDGSIWFATNSGATRFDGYHWQTYGEESGLSGLPVNAVVSTNAGAILSATQNGIYQFADGRWKTLFQDTTIALHFNRFSTTESGLVFGVFEDGFALINDSEVTHIYSTSEIISTLKTNNHKVNGIILPEAFILSDPLVSITDILQDDLHNVWVALTHFNEGKVLKFRLESNLNSFEKYMVYHSDKYMPLGLNQRFMKSSDGDIWIVCGSYNVGINRISGNVKTYYKTSEKFGGDDMHTDIMETKNGDILVGGLGKLFAFKSGEWTSYAYPKVPIPTSCRIFFTELSDGNLWIGGLQNEIFSMEYSNQTWCTYEGLIYQAESEEAQYFISEQGQVVEAKGNNWRVSGMKDGLMDAPVRLIYTRQHQLWVVGSHKGAAATAVLKDEKWQLHIHPKLSWGIDYRAVLEAADGGLWFGCAVDIQESKGHLSGVLHLVDPMAEELHWEHLHTEHGVSNKNAYGLGEAQGKIWLGGSKLLSFDGKNWSPVMNPPELNEFVNNIFSPKNGALYIGSRYYGLFIFDGESWTNYTTKSGLRSNTIIDIYAQSRDDIWLATDNDISHFDGKSWATNLLPEEMNMSNEGGSIFKDSQNTLWINKAPREWKRRAFAYNKTLSSTFSDFRTFRYHPETKPPVVAISKHANKIANNGQITLFWEGTDFFEQTPDDRLTYSYRLDGADWTEFASVKSQTFSDMDPGDHLFELRVRDLDLNISTDVVATKFEVLHPVWRQPWFIFLMLFFIAAIWIFISQIFKRDQKLILSNHSLNEANANLEAQKGKIEDQNEKLVQMLDKIEQLSNSKLDFYTNISHELRTPLTLILGNVEILKKNIAEADVEGAPVDVINRNAVRLLTLINQILEFRKMESGILNFTSRKGDLNMFLRQIVNLFRSLAEQKQIDLTFRENSKSRFSFFDHDKVEKIIFNLLSNAFKHTPIGGSIAVEVSHLKESELKTKASEALKNGAYFEIMVKDSGKGIPEEHLTQIFERFYQVKDDKDHKMYEMGSGIGLSYIADLVKAHEGEIHVKSEVGAGTTFVIYLPEMHEGDEHVEASENLL